ncbi:MAG: hypothetical protein U1E08_03245 [Coriobacteriia bacterium]|nr:hypothetical protein [Coriobacteriia bacterium]
MTRRSRGRLTIITAVALAAAVVVVLAYPRGAASAESRTITVSAPASTASCMYCHPTLGGSDRGDLVFDHATHIVAQCAACHYGPAHAGGASPTPPMDSCFTCHDLRHGPQGLLASGECRSCHPEPAPLRPATHVEDWRDEPHALASDEGVNRCMMCHDAPTDCDSCHSDEGVDVGPMPAMYLSTVPQISAEPTVTIDPDGPVTMAQCTYCHSDIDDFDVDGLVFGHGAHLERAYRCESCHPVFPHGPDGTQRIEMRSCYRCHSLVHDGHGEVASGECEKCHTEDFELIPPDHTLEFLTGEHREPALEDAAYCSQCHTSESCVPCHNGGVEMADGTESLPVVPADHRKPQWASEHGGLYLAQDGLCAVCHEPASCQTCHLTTMPHPGTWMTEHAKMNGSLTNDCRVCHTDREFCQDCHHDSVRSVALIPENCVECHEEMRTEPATAIKVAGLAEHAVHFIVEEKKGEPYYCDDCHIGFGSGGIHVVNAATGPHDMRICYECHGALDYQNILIAPYRGSELCLRCHTDLNI